MTSVHRETLTADRTVLAAVLAVTAVSWGGALISVRADLSPTLLEALGPDGHLSIPLPMTAFHVVAAVAAGSRRRGVSLTGSALLALAVTVAVVSGFFDGGYADDRLTPAQRGYQWLLLAGLVAVAVVSTRRFVTVWRARR